MKTPHKKNSHTKSLASPSEELLIDLMLTPIRIPHGFSLKLEEIRNTADRIVNETVRETLTRHILPPTTLLAQFVSANAKVEKLGFPAPALVKNRIPDASNVEAILRRFCFIAGYNDKRNTYFYRRVLQFVHNPHGTILIIRAANEKLPNVRDLADTLPHLNVISITFRTAPEWESHFPPLDSISIERDSRRTKVSGNTETTHYSEHSVPDIISQQSNRAIIDAIPKFDTERLPGLPEVAYYPAKGSNIAEIERLAKDIGDDADYLARIYPIATCGNLLLCAPRPLHFEHDASSGSLNHDLGLFGLTLVFDKTELLTKDLIMRSYLLTQKLGVFVTSSFNLALDTAYNHQAEILREGAHVIIGSLSNCCDCLDTAARIPNQGNIEALRASLLLAKSNAEAILAQSRKQGKIVPAHVDLASELQGVFNTIRGEFCILREISVNAEIRFPGRFPYILDAPLFRVALTELLRNAFEHVIHHPVAIERTVCLTLTNENGTARILIENGGKLPCDAELSVLNAETDASQIDVPLTRKGSTHYGVGTNTAKSIIRKKLRGALLFKNLNGRLACVVSLPKQ